MRSAVWGVRDAAGCVEILGGCLTKAALGCAAALVFIWLLSVALNPWALHIGGRQTPLLNWHGVGTVVAQDGKSYPLVLWFWPGRPHRHGGARREGRTWSADLQGTAWLCVAPGRPKRMQVSGTMYGGYLNADNSLFSFRVLEWRRPFTIDDRNRGFFDLAGTFDGQEMALTRPGEQGIKLNTGPFLDHATVRLHWANKSEFDAQCR